jgi:ABC-type transport system substrate-binding protein
VANSDAGQQGTKRKPEIVEVYMRDSQDAFDALQRGEIDIIDQVFPADVDRLRANPNIDVQPYGLPTVHMLVPNTENEFLNNLTFRLALIYGINREVILNNLILNGREDPGCQLISGPFPMGSREGELASSDAVGYAYNTETDIRPYEPRLASTRVILAQRQLEAAAEKLKKEPPKLQPLILAYPAGEVYRIACQAIEQSLKGIGVEVQLKELPPGVTNDPERQWDLLYVDAAVWEPLIDARKIVGPEGFTAAPGPFINLALRRLDGASDWTSARRRLWDVHSIVHQDATIIPLWQMVNYYARRNKIRNVGSRPLTIYDNVAVWQVVTQ